MTIQQLSIRIGELYNLQPYDCIIDTVWLVSDWNRLMPLAVENDVFYDCIPNIGVAAYCFSSDEYWDGNYADHPPKEVATQVAIARALIAIKE